MDKLRDPKFIEKHGYMTVQDFLKAECKDRVAEVQKHMDGLIKQFRRKADDHIEDLRKRVAAAEKQ